jgi:hypothetical protein
MCFLVLACLSFLPYPVQRAAGKYWGGGGGAAIGNVGVSKQTEWQLCYNNNKNFLGDLKFSF